MGLVQIPCIERNAFAAARALDCATFAIIGDGRHRIPFDSIVEAMKRTGHDLPAIYRETAEGGLALLVE
jgi:L-serine dehydratase